MDTEERQKPGGYPPTLNQLPILAAPSPGSWEAGQREASAFPPSQIDPHQLADVKTTNSHGIIWIRIYNKTKGCGKRFEIIFLPGRPMPRTPLCLLDSYACPKMAKPRGYQSTLGHRPVNSLPAVCCLLSAVCCLLSAVCQSQRLWPSDLFSGTSSPEPLDKKSNSHGIICMRKR